MSILSFQLQCTCTHSIICAVKNLIYTEVYYLTWTECVLCALLSLLLAHVCFECVCLTVCRLTVFLLTVCVCVCVCVYACVWTCAHVFKVCELPGPLLLIGRPISPLFVMRLGYFTGPIFHAYINSAIQLSTYHSVHVIGQEHLVICHSCLVRVCDRLLCITHYEWTFQTRHLHKVIVCFVYTLTITCLGTGFR
jgi:hypothetical protein